MKTYTYTDNKNKVVAFTYVATNDESILIADAAYNKQTGNDITKQNHIGCRIITEVRKEVKKFILGKNYYCIFNYDNNDCVLDLHKIVDDSLVPDYREIGKLGMIELAKQIVQYKIECDANGINMSKEKAAYKKVLGVILNEKELYIEPELKAKEKPAPVINYNNNIRPDFSKEYDKSKFLYCDFVQAPNCSRIVVDKNNAVGWFNTKHRNLHMCGACAAEKDRIEPNWRVKWEPTPAVKLRLNFGDTYLTFNFNSSALELRKTINDTVIDLSALKAYYVIEAVKQLKRYESVGKEKEVIDNFLVLPEIKSVFEVKLPPQNNKGKHYVYKTEKFNKLRCDFNQVQHCFNFTGKVVYFFLTRGRHHICFNCAENLRSVQPDWIHTLDATSVVEDKY